jgi:hypothetical protein
LRLDVLWLVDLRLELLRLEFRFRPPDVLRPPPGDGTFAPFSRASLSPIAIAWLRLFTFCPLPLRRVPCLRRRIALSTVSWDFLP